MESVPAARRRFFPEVSGILTKDNEPIFCFRLWPQTKRDYIKKTIKTSLPQPPKAVSVLSLQPACWLSSDTSALSLLSPFKKEEILYI
jgi:hypothetical protein